MLLKYILLGFFLYFIFRFVFDFIVPVVKTTRQVKKQFDQVREQQQQYYQQQQTTQEPNRNKTSAVDQDDYLEFEEIK